VVRAKGANKWLLLALAALIVLASHFLWDLGGRQSNVQAAGCWQATITEQWTDTDLIGSVLRVSVLGKAWLPVKVHSRGDFHTVSYTSTKPEYGPFVAEFAPLSRGIYYIEPQGLGTVFEVWLDGQNYTRVDFTPQPCAPTPTFTPPQPTATPRSKIWPTPHLVTSTPKPLAPTPRPQSLQGWHGHIAQHQKHRTDLYWASIAVRVNGRPAG